MVHSSVYWHTGGGMKFSLLWNRWVINRRLKTYLLIKVYKFLTIKEQKWVKRCIFLAALTTLCTYFNLKVLFYIWWRLQNNCISRLCCRCKCISASRAGYHGIHSNPEQDKKYLLLAVRSHTHKHTHTQSSSHLQIPIILPHCIKYPLPKYMP